MARVLVLFFHPNWEKSRTNRRLVTEIQTLKGVNFRDLYELYPDFDIDVEREQQALLDHDEIVFHHPFYWYNCPPLMKQYLDLVLAHGWAYGAKGTRLEGKRWQQVITSGGPASVYQSEGMNRHTVEEFLFPFEQTARLCRMVWRPPFAIQGTHLMPPEELVRRASDYRQLLEQAAAFQTGAAHE